MRAISGLCEPLSHNTAGVACAAAAAALAAEGLLQVLAVPTTGALYFDNVSFDAVAFGCVAVAWKHRAECDALPPLLADSGATRTGAAGGHDDLAAEPPSVMRPWLPLLHNCTVMYDTPTSAARLASILGTEAAGVGRAC
eukprot:363490-Chlamydomonas_euryale.AAC.13